MIWTTATQFIVIGMAAFCISFGLIYSLIFCYKSRRKQSCPEETERLRDELLKDKLITRRKSTSLTSPPSSDSVVNPNYNASPLRVPQRHLRSTTASYSPTHYLSPHHRRNSTPTQAPACSSISTAECSCCGCPRGITSKSKSPTCNSNIEHSITSSLSSSSTSSSESTPLQQLDHNHSGNGNDGETCACGTKALGEEFLDEDELNFLSTHKCKMIPVQKKPKPKSKLTLDWNNGEDLGEHGHHHHHQKSFTFGPIPAARKARNSIQNANACQQKNGPGITLTVTTPATLTTTFTTQTVNTNANLNLKDGQEWDEKQPLLVKKLDKERFVCEKEKNETDNEERKAAEADSDNNKTGCMINNNSLKRKTYTPDLFKKENTVLEEIPYYLEHDGMACN